MDDLTLYIPLLIVFAFLILGLWWWARKRPQSEPPMRYSKWGGFGEQIVETDLRLTYRRFKELYPHSQITYREYKKLQAEKSFKRAVSSQKIKRMVR